MLRFLKGKGNGASGGDDAQKSGFNKVWDAVKKPFDKNEKELQKLQPLLEKVNALGPNLKAKSDDELKARSDELKREFRELVTQRLRERGSDWHEPNFDPLGIDQEYERLRRAVEKGVLDDLLPEAFALVRETSERTIGLRHYDVQITGGAVLHSGRIAEMKTGEGKTLVASLPVYLNALTGRGVHLVTVNDYLAERDANWMRPIYEFLGLTVAFINNNSTTEDRKAAYACDVLYATNSEVGFDYLRDNMALDPDGLAQRPLNFGIVDEVDNILIDEARTPLIISAQVEQSERAQRKRRHAKVLDLVARKLVPATTDRDVDDLIARHKQSNNLDVKGLLDFILKRGCVQEAMQYLIESYVKPDSPARAENVAKLLTLVNEIHDGQLIGSNAQQGLAELATQTATSEQIAAMIRNEAEHVIQPFGEALSVVLHQMQEQTDKESRIGAALAVLQGLLHINTDFLATVEDRMRTRDDDHAIRYDATTALLEEFARRRWIDEGEVASLAEALFEAEPAAATQSFGDGVVASRGRLATALALADEFARAEVDSPRKVSIVEQISTEGLLPHDACERLWELVRIREPHDEMVRRITTSIANEPGANAQAIGALVADFAQSRQQWLKEGSDRLRNELGALPNLGKPVIDTLFQRARDGAAPEEMRRALRQELYRFAPNSEVQKAVRKFAQDRARAMEQLGVNLLRELDELDLPKESRRMAQTILAGGGHADGMRRDLHALVSDLPDESREAENIVAHTVNEVIKWREQNGDALADALIALVELPASAQTTIATAVHNGAAPEVLEEIVADELLKLSANERIANCVAGFADDWAAWRELQANATLNQMGGRITLNDDLRELLREELVDPTNPQELPGRCLTLIARDVIGRHLEPLLTPESAEAFTEELKRRLPMEKKMPNRLRAADFAGKNQEQLMRAVVRLVEEALQTVVIEDMPRLVKSYGWFTEKDEKHHAAGMSDMGTLIAEREIGRPTFPDPEDFLNVLVENQVLREEEAAMVGQAMVGDNQQQVSIVVPQVIALEPARRRKLAELKMQEVQSVLDQAVKAHTLYHKDVHYVIEGGNEIVIVDEFTGRKMPGRRWSDGLHEAVEAKERVEVRLESQTVATVTIQNYFRLYHKLAGMTGTAKTEESEFIKTYGLEVVSIPTNQPVRRTDYPDIIFKTAESKTRSTCFEILELYCKGQPALVGTRSVEVSERLSERLKAQHLQTLCLTQLIKFKLWDDNKIDNKTKGELVTRLNVPLPQLNVAAVRGIAREQGIAPDVTSGDNLHQIKERLNLTEEHLPRLEAALKGGIPHNVLNAKNHRNEARIVAEAARVSAVTIATNMAGRGVDILLGGTLDNEAKLRVITRQIVSRHLKGQFSRVRSRNAETTDVIMRRLTPQSLQQLVWVSAIDNRLAELQQNKEIDSSIAKDIRDAYATELTANDLRGRVRARARRLNVNALLPLDDESLNEARSRHAQKVFWAEAVSIADIQKTIERGVLAHPYQIEARDTLLLRALFQLADREDERVYHLLHELTSLPDLDRALMEAVALGVSLDPEQLAREMQRRNAKAQPVSVNWVEDRLRAFEVRDSASAQRWLANAALPEVELNDSQILQAVSSRLGSGEGADRAWLQQKLRGLNVVRSERRYSAGDDAMFVHLRVERDALNRLASTINGSIGNGSRWRTSGDDRLKLTDSEVSFDEVLGFIRAHSPQAIWATRDWLETRLLELAIVRDQQEVRVLPPREGLAPTVLFRLRPQRLLELLDQRLTDSLIRLVRDTVTNDLDTERIAHDLLESIPEARSWVDGAWVAERLHALGYGSSREGRFVLKHEAMPTVLIETGVAGQAADWVLPGEKRPDDIVQTSEYFEVKKLGGLHIIGTERHESRRIDNQLRGRAGRQGDPGSSRFYVSLEDELWRLFGVRGGFLLNQWQEDEQVEFKLISKQIENAQKKVEMNHFESRKHTLQYDDVMNVQREAIYKMRRKALLGVGLRESTQTMIDEVVKWNVNRYCPPLLQPEEWDLRRLHQAITKLFGSERATDYYREADLHGRPREELMTLLAEALTKAYETREQDIGPDHMRELERYQVCDTVGEYWMQHLAEMELLREGINLRAWGQRDPLVEYRKEAYEMFQNMMANIQNETIEFLMGVPVEAAVEWAGRRLRSRVSSMRYQWAETTTDSMGEVETYTHTTVKVGRNDPCPCGSGKKYKQCCLKKRREDV